MKINIITFYHRTEEFPTKYSLGALRLATYISNIKDVVVEVVPIDLFESDNKILSILDKYNADIIAFPLYIWTRDKVKTSVKMLREHNFSGEILIGGPDVLSKDNFEWFGDEIIIAGEGEKALKAIVEYHAKNGQIRIEDLDLNNVCLGKNMDEFKWELNNDDIAYCMPLLSKQMDSVLSNYDIGNEFFWYETCRGCQYNCGYCGHKSRKNIAYFDLDTIKEEIINIGKHNIKEVFVIDPNLGGNIERGKKILSYFNEYSPNTSIIAYLRPEFVDDEYLNILKVANIKEIRVGIQTLNPQVPGWIRSNKLSSINTFLPKLMENNVFWRGELIVGLPGDTFEGLRSSIKTLVEQVKPSEIHAYTLTIINGTKIGDILNKTDLDYWVKKDDLTHSVIESNSFTNEELNIMIKYAQSITSFYNVYSGEDRFNFEFIENKVNSHLQTLRLVNNIEYEKYKFDDWTMYWKSICNSRAVI